MWYELTEEQMHMKGVAEEVARRLPPILQEADEKGVYPVSAIGMMQDAGLLRLLIPKKYGGLEKDLTTSCLCQEELGKFDAGLSNVISDESIPAVILNLYGTEEQKERYLRPTAIEGKKWCSAITEPGAGSDIGSIKTRAVADGDYYTLNGSKTWASLAAMADYFWVVASTNPAKRSRGLTVFIMEKEASGFRIVRDIPKRSWKTFPAVDFTLENVRLPKENMLGQEDAGAKVFFSALNVGRVGIGAQSLGVAEGALAYAKDFAKARVQFDQPVAEFQAVRFMLADMATGIEAMRALTYTAAWLVDHKRPEAEKLCCMVKYFASDMVLKITTDAVQILGAAGLTEDHPVEKMWRDSKAFQIMDGTNEIMRDLVGRMLLR